MSNPFETPAVTSSLSVDVNTGYLSTRNGDDIIGEADINELKDSVPVDTSVSRYYLARVSSLLLLSIFPIVSGARTYFY